MTNGLRKRNKTTTKPLCLSTGINKGSLVCLCLLPRVKLSRHPGCLLCRLRWGSKDGRQMYCWYFAFQNFLRIQRNKQRTLACRGHIYSFLPQISKEFRLTSGHGILVIVGLYGVSTHCIERHIFLRINKALPKPSCK